MLQLLLPRSQKWTVFPEQILWTQVHAGTKISCQYTVNTFCRSPSMTSVLLRGEEGGPGHSCSLHTLPHNCSKMNMNQTKICRLMTRMECGMCLTSCRVEEISSLTLTLNIWIALQLKQYNLRGFRELKEWIIYCILWLTQQSTNTVKVHNPTISVYTLLAKKSTLLHIFNI